MGILPKLDSVEKQLKATINLLHAMGKAVGMDVIPHTDRFSEIALANPAYFEWLQREGVEIVDHQAELHIEVEARIMAFLQSKGPAIPGDALPISAEDFYSSSYPEEQRRRVLFGLSRRSRRPC